MPEIVVATEDVLPPNEVETIDEPTDASAAPADESGTIEVPVISTTEADASEVSDFELNSGAL